MQTVTVSTICHQLDIPKMAADALGIDEGAQLTTAQLQAAITATWELGLAVCSDALSTTTTETEFIYGPEIETDPPGFSSACPPETGPTEWKLHDGGKSPVPLNMAVRFRVEVILRGVSCPVTGYASDFSWQHLGVRNGDVIYWRFPGPL
ncbi:hypothetical protein [Herbaspirillum sp.]|uniref:hypothetical protein n=1 Tax=Herbaspirillum sp. TaxID=1890675 RepID=UPI00258A7312|nr:hypothetical protein [Herbaspirillum sp.]MCP3947345.1 hypothetical protein [Herbaspirillum sp.]